MKLSDNVVFWRTPDFINAFGLMDSITYHYLKEQVIAGKGNIITMASGFRSIEILVQIPGKANPSWLVVFAVYNMLDLVVFIKKYPVDTDGFILISENNPKPRQPLQFRKKLSTNQQMSLAKVKKILDEAVKKRFRKKR